MTTIPASDARASLPSLLDRVQAGEEVTITRHGKAVAVLVRPDSLRTRRAGPVLAGAATLHRQLAEARLRPLSEDGISEARADELIADIRAGREGR
ncbi:MAG: type II toxin-antitoxin system prevent-host-death family antitoxin [Actinomycetota bacterium]